MSSRVEVKLPSKLLEASSPQDLVEFQDRLRQADIRVRRDESDWYVHPFKGPEEPFILAQPLQRDDGQLRSDTGAILEAQPGALSIDVGMGTAAGLRSLGYSPELETGRPYSQIQARLLCEVDPIPGLRDLLTIDPAIRLFRLRPTAKLTFREGFWRLVTGATDINAPVTWADARSSGKLPGLGAASTPVYLLPIPFVIGPLVARFQPIAAAFSTARGVQIVAISDKGFRRNRGLEGWPVGMRHMLLTGATSGESQLPDPAKLPTGHAKQLLDALVRGANTLLEWLTSPVIWCTSEGNVDPLERNIAWSTALFGLQELMELGREWTDETSLWTVFRALGMLEGHWGNGKQVLRRMLKPDVILDHAVSRFPDTTYRSWATRIVEKYEAEIVKADPKGNMDEALRKIEHMRHLIHGTGLGKTQRRGERLEALKMMRQPDGGEMRAVDLRLVQDVAVFWWAAAIFSPDTNFVVGTTPFGPS